MATTPEEITNLYLYGTRTRPADLTSDTLIRPPNTAPVAITQDVTAPVAGASA